MRRRLVVVTAALTGLLVRLHRHELELHAHGHLSAGRDFVLMGSLDR